MITTSDLSHLDTALEQAGIRVAITQYNIHLLHEVFENDDFFREYFQRAIFPLFGSEQELEDLHNTLIEARHIIWNEQYYRSQEENLTLQTINDDEIPF